MEPKVSYTLVGTFVLLFGAALVAGLFWLSAGQRQQHYTTYVTYMYESVAGLNINAPVKYRGVTVGKVARIALDHADPRRVRLRLDIQQGTPVKEDTVAVLASQSYITGLAYVELTGGSKDSPPLRAAAGAKYPQIDTAPSLSTRVENAVPELLTQLKTVATRLATVTDRVNGVLDDKNRAALADTLANVDKLSATLARRSDKLGRSIDNVADLTSSVARVGRDLPALLKQVRGAVASVDSAANSVQKVANGGAREMRRFTHGTLGQTNQLLGQLRELTGDLQRLAQELQSNPNMLVFGRTVPAPGPGEKK